MISHADRAREGVGLPRAAVAAGWAAWRMSAPPGRAVKSVIHWPGMRSEYAWLPPLDEPTATLPHQVGVSFSRHSRQEYECAGRAVRADIPAGAVFVTGDDGITWG